MLEEIERCCIQPLQIIEEQRERMLVASEHPEKAPEDHLEAVLRILRRQVRDRSLLSNHKLQLGNEVDDDLTIRSERLVEGVPPPAKLGLALAQERADKALKGLAQVAYGMSRLYWSNLPEANRPRDGTRALCSSFATEDLPIPE